MTAIASHPLPLTIKKELPEKIQELPANMAHFCLRIGRFLEKELKTDLRGASILAGFSGGADSTALLLVLHYLAPHYSFNLHAAHLDHALRPSSAAEALACAAFCDNLGIVCHTAKVDVNALAKEEKIGTEEAARKARYNFFERCLAENFYDLLALGHHGNDLAEDILMRLLRGTGWPALGGMPGKDDARKLIRPLLLTPRQELEEFLTTLDVGWITDESNMDHIYLRNRIRGRILPLLLEENPSFLQTVANLWRLARIDEDYFSAAMGETREIAADLDELSLDAGTLTRMHKALRLRLYKKFSESVGEGETRLSNLLALDEAWLNNPEPSTHLLGNKKTARVRKKAITWRRNK